MAFMKAVQHDFYFHNLLWTSNNASVVHSVIAQKATSKNTIILFKDPVLSIMLYAFLLLSLFARERGFYCFPGFCFSRGKHSIAWKEIITSRASGLFKLAISKSVLNCCLVNKVHE